MGNSLTGLKGGKLHAPVTVMLNITYSSHAHSQWRNCSPKSLHGHFEAGNTTNLEPLAQVSIRPRRCPGHVPLFHCDTLTASKWYLSSKKGFFILRLTLLHIRSNFLSIIDWPSLTTGTRLSKPVDIPRVLKLCIFQQHKMLPHLATIDPTFIFLTVDNFLTLDHNLMLFLGSLEFVCF